MKVEKVYKLLEELKGKDSDLVNKSNRILKYIYQDIYLGYLGKAKKEAVDRVVMDGAQVGSIRYNDTLQPFEEMQKHISIFLDGDESILAYYLELILEKDPRFIELFFNKTSTYFEIVDNHFFTEDDFKVYSCAFNIYTMLAAYHKHKDNYDVYAKVVEDCSALINCNGFGERYTNSFSKLEDRKRMIDLILDSNCYLEVKFIRDMLVDVLQHIGHNYISYKIELIEKDMETINKIFNDYQEVSKSVSKDNMIDLDVVISKCIQTNNRYRYSYYSKTLLIGDRLDFVNNRLREAFLEEDYRNQAFGDISLLDYSFFEYLNSLDKYNNSDSFIVILNTLFDSDTYYEYNSKMESIKEAIECFKTGDISKALENINSLDSLTHKKVIDGALVSSLTNVMNPVSKEVSIFRRMSNLYGDIYRDKNINISAILRSVRDDSNLVSFDKDLDSAIAESISNNAALRLIEEQRQREIRDTLDDMAKVQREQDESSKAVGPINNNTSDKPLQKRKGFFGRR